MPEAQLYALFLLSFAMDEAPWVAEGATRLAGDMHEQFMSRIGELSFELVIVALGLRNKVNRTSKTVALEVIIQARRPRAWCQ